MTYVMEAATRHDLAWIAANAARVYQGDDVIPLAKLESWYDVNLHGFWMVRTLDGEPVGNVDLLPVKADLFAPFVAGDATERDIEPYWLYPPDQRDQIRDIYVESIVATTMRAAARIVASFDTLLGGLCPVEQVRQIYAIAASGGGQRILRRRGFTIKTPARRRRDQHDLYSRTLRLA